MSANNVFLEETTYLTDEEFTESTRITDDALVGDDAADGRAILIRKAEVAIDSLIWTFGTKEDPDQETVFPTVENGIPKAVKKAAVLLVEAMYLGGELSESSNYSGAKFVKSETHGDHKIEFQAETVTTNAMRKKNQYVTQEIETLLKPFVTVSSGVRWSRS